MYFVLLVYYYITFVRVRNVIYCIIICNTTSSNNIATINTTLNNIQIRITKYYLQCQLFSIQ